MSRCLGILSFPSVPSSPRRCDHRGELVPSELLLFPSMPSSPRRCDESCTSICPGMRGLQSMPSSPRLLSGESGTAGTGCCPAHQSEANQEHSSRRATGRSGCARTAGLPPPGSGIGELQSASCVPERTPSRYLHRQPALAGATRIEADRALLWQSRVRDRAIRAGISGRLMSHCGGNDWDDGAEEHRFLSAVRLPGRCNGPDQMSQ